METRNNYTGYFFKKIYVIPSFPSPKWHKADLVSKKLGRPADNVMMPEGNRYKEFIKCKDTEHSCQCLSAWVEALQDAVDNKYRRVLILKDDAVFHIDFDTLLKQATAGPASKSWEVIDFGGNAWGMTLEQCQHLLEALYQQKIDSQIALMETIEKVPPVEIESLIVHPSAINDSNWHLYYYNYDPRNTKVTFCCATARPECIENVLCNFTRQDYPNKELIIVTNGYDPGIAESAAQKNGVKECKVISTEAAVTLGECLNMGVAESNGQFWAKMDDDDFYGKNYLDEAVEFLISFPYDSVGKVNFHVFFPDQHNGCCTTDKEYQYADFPRLSGPTIFTTKRVLNEIPFRHLNMGEDHDFYLDLHKKDYHILSTTQHNLVYIRHNNNISEFERHLSNPWNTENCRLYQEFVSGYPFIDQIDLPTIEPADFANYINQIVPNHQIDTAIPKKIHQVWIGPEAPPHHWLKTWYEDYLQENPGWEYRLWTEADYEELGIEEDEYFSKLSYSGRSDIIRYKILSKHGGIYIDADSANLGNGSLDDIISRNNPYGIFMAEEPFFDEVQPLIAIGVIACTPGNVILDYFYHRARRLVREANEAGIEFEAWQKTGPVMATEVLNHISKIPILPAHLFFPEYWNKAHYWDLSLDELKQRYPNSLMFQFGYSTVKGLG